jgi:hypothetical protein
VTQRVFEPLRNFPFRMVEQRRCRPFCSVGRISGASTASDYVFILPLSVFRCQQRLDLSSNRRSQGRGATLFPNHGSGCLLCLSPLRDASTKDATVCKDTFGRGSLDIQRHRCVDPVLWCERSELYQFTIARPRTKLSQDNESELQAARVARLRAYRRGW